VSPVIIPDEIPITREIQRPLELRQDDYESLFDHKTLFYDVFTYGDKIIFSGPPLFNLHRFMKTAKIKIDDVLTHHPFISKDKNQTQYSHLEFHGQAKKMDINTKSFKTSLVIQPNHNELFDNKKVLLGIQKDSELEWIKDWVDFYVKVHGVNAILLYDNASSLYTPSDIIQTLKAVKNLDIVVVVPWNFKFGPGPGSSNLWDSLFCQYSMLEHARRRFLASCYGVINADVDELVISDDNKTVFDHLALSDKGAIRYTGIWIDSATNSSSNASRHRDFKYTAIPPSLCTKKWTLRPSAISDDIQFQIHDFGSGFVPTFVDALKYRHFKAINTGWKHFYRKDIVLPKDNTHMIDYKLVAVMNTLDIVYVSLGENALTDDILKRHGLKSFTTPYSSGGGNIDYAIFLESIGYKGLLERENLKYDYTGNKKVVRSTIASNSDDIYDKSYMNGFEFAKNDVIGSDNDKYSFNGTIQQLLELRGGAQVVFFYYHRINKNSNLESIFEKASKFLEFYSKKEQALMVIFVQKIIKDKTERKLTYKKVNNTIHFFEFCTEQVWGGNNPDIYWARVDDDLVKEMIQSSVGIVQSKFAK
jgi:hypothetical protein